MLQTILLVVMILISIALIGVVLLQRSEGGALGMGGGPTGFMTARGAGNLLTKSTWILGAMFAICAIVLTILGNMNQRTGSAFDAEDIGRSVGAQPGATAPAQPEAPATPPAQGDSLSLDNLPVGGGEAASSETPAQ